MTGTAVAPERDRTRPSGGMLEWLNPLAKVAEVLPASVALIGVRDITTPAIVAAVAMLVLVAGARWTPLRARAVLLSIPVLLLVTAVSFTLWTDASGVADTPVLVQLGAWQVHLGAVQIGVATALRVCAIAVLWLIPVLTTDSADMARALNQQLRLPYRVTYTMNNALRFPARSVREFDTIRAARRVRGLRMGLSAVIPLLAGSIRHAEKVAIAADSREFGAYPQRTERYRVAWRGVDTVSVVLGMLAGVAIVGTIIA